MWYLGIVCLNHTIGDKEWFVSMNDKVKSRIQFLDNKSVNVEGMGKVMIQRKDDQQTLFSDVPYVPNIKNSQLNIG